MIEDDELRRRNEDVLAAAHDNAAPGPGSPPPPDLALIFEQHHAAVLRAAWRITGNPMDAEDVLQTVFVRLLRRPGPTGPAGSGSASAGAGDANDADSAADVDSANDGDSAGDAGGAHRLDLSQSVGSYLHRAAVNAALDLLRSRRRSRLVALADTEEPIDESRPGPERRSSSRELGRRLRAALSRLSPRQAEIFALRYLEGMGNLEIARLLGSSQTAVAVILHRARHRLQQELRPAPGGRS
jgi:RNA polymerase sigma factor (sigma-70 family)